MDSAVKELLSEIFKADSFYYLYIINTVNVSSIVFFTYLSYFGENYLSLGFIFIIGILSISMIYDDINDDRKLIKRKLSSILLCNLTGEG